MAGILGLLNSSAGSSDEKAARFNQLLFHIHKHVHEDEVLSRKLDYHVKKKGENDQTRMARFFKFNGPDDDTTAVLENNLTRWLRHPESFWIRPQTTASSAISPRAGIAICYIQTKRDDA